jgi:nucleoside-diphosphate-sugar epimerase
MIFITGSTGFIGRNLLPLLRARSHRTRCFIRQHSMTEKISSFCDDKMIGDIMDEHSLTHAMAGCDTVIHMAGIKAETFRASFEGNFYLGTRHVVDAAKRLGVKHFIFMSACGASPEAKSRFNHYKWLAEEYLRHSGLRYTILRTTIVYGPGDHFVSRWMRVLKSFPLLPIFGDRNHLLQPVSVKDLSECIIKILENPAMQGQIHELGGPSRMTLPHAIKMISEAMGKKVRLILFPLQLVKPFAYLSEVFLSEPPLTSDEITRWMENEVCDYERVQKQFGFNLTHFKDGLQEYFSKNHGHGA